METIKKTGVSEWLTEQGKKWMCADCGTNFSWYATRCTSCGKKLKKYSFKMSFLKSLFMKLTINLVPKQK